MGYNASIPSQAGPSYPAPAGGGNVNTQLGVTGTALIKSAPGSVIKAVVTVAGSTAGGIYDCTATAAAITANQIAVLPASVQSIDVEFPCMVGIFVITGTNQQIAISYE